MKIITCTGFGNSGSSAATDFFSEFENVKVIPHDFECTFIHESDGLYDLEKAIEEGHRLKVDLAVKRFLLLAENLQKNEYYRFFDGNFLDETYTFINKVIGCKWTGWWHRAFETKKVTKKEKLYSLYLNRKFVKAQKKQNYSLYENDSWMPSYLPGIDEYYDCDIEKFRSEAKNYLEILFNLLNKEKKEYILIDQLLPPIHSELYLHYFDNIKVVIVDRDPRDYYVCNNLFWGSRYIPSSNLDTYISWYKKTRECVFESDNVKKIYLEDFVYNYESISKAIIEFVGLKENNHINKGKLLIPENSKKNTLVFTKYINYSNDVSIISQKLQSSLFNYSNLQINNDNKLLMSIPTIKQLENFDSLRKNKISIFFFIFCFIYCFKRVLKIFLKKK